MNMPYLDHARMMAAQLFMADHDLDEDYVSDLELAFSTAEMVNPLESDNLVTATFILDDSMVYHVALTLSGGMIVATSIQGRDLGGE